MLMWKHVSGFLPSTIRRVMAEVCGKSDVKALGFGRPSLTNLNFEVPKDERCAPRSFVSSKRTGESMASGRFGGSWAAKVSMSPDAPWHG